MKENDNKKDLFFDKVLKRNGKYYYYDYDKDKEDIEEHGVFKMNLTTLGVVYMKYNPYEINKVIDPHSNVGKRNGIKWKDPMQEKGMSLYVRGLLIISAIVCVIMTYSYYQELGGFEWVLGNWQSVVSSDKYFWYLGGIILLPILSIVCLYFSVKKRE